MARPVVKISWTEFDKLLEMQCTLEEIAAWFRCSVDTIERHVKTNKGMGFAEYSGSIRACIGRITLRRALWRTALGKKKGSLPDKTLLIFLSKQYLGFADKSEMKLERVSDEELVRVIRKRLEPKEGE